MKTIGSSLLFAICTLSLAATAQAGERWQEIGSGGYRVYAPPSWVVERGGATDLIISAAKPEAAKMSFTVMNNPGRNGDLPDIYGVMDMARSLARFYKISLTSEPDSGGRPIAGQEAIGAYASGVMQGVGIDFRVYMTRMPGRNDKLLFVSSISNPAAANQYEAYRYAVLDSIVLEKGPGVAPALGRHVMAGYGSGGSASAAYAGRAEIFIERQQRYRMGESEVIGFGVNGKVLSGEKGSFVADGSTLILFSDDIPSWPEHDNKGQLPRRVALRE